MKSSSIWSTIGCYISRSWYYPALAVAFLIGWLIPGVGTSMKAWGLTPYIVALAFFLNGFTLPTELLLGNLRQWQMLLASLVIIFVISPALVYLVRLWLPGGHTALAEGFQLLAVVPTMLVSAVVLTRMAGGNGAAALYLTVIANLVAIVVVPPLLHLTLGRTGIYLDLPSIAKSLIITVLIPTLAGQGARKFWAAWATRHQRLLGVISQCTILLFIITGMAAIPRGAISPTIWAIVIGASFLFHVVLLIIGHFTGYLLRLDTGTQRALTLCTSEKSMVFASFLWEQLMVVLGPTFGIAALPWIVYYVMELVLDGMLAHRWGREVRQQHPLPPCAD